MILGFLLLAFTTWSCAEAYGITYPSALSSCPSASSRAGGGPYPPEPGASMTSRAPAGTRRDPLLLSVCTAPSGSSSQRHIGAPERPPPRPKGGVSVRSQHTAACASCPSTRQTRRAPSPPRQVPAPPESGM